MSTTSDMHSAHFRPMLIVLTEVISYIHFFVDIGRGHVESIP